MSSKLNRRTLITSAGTLTAGGLLLGAQQAGQASSRNITNTPTDPLKIGYLPITDSSPLLLAHALGYYQEAGIEVAKPVLFRSWASLTEAFISGTVDVIHLLMPMAVYLKFDLGADAQVVAWNHVNGSALTLAPHITDTRQLAGKTLAVPAWFSIHNILLQKILKEAGLTPVIRKTPNQAQKEVALIVMAPSDMIPALANGTIAGFTVADPFNAAAHSSGTGTIHRFMGDVWRDHACCVTMMRTPLIEASGGTAQKFLNALVKAQIYARENRKEAATILSDKKYLPQKPAAILRAMTSHFHDHKDTIKHPDWGGELLQFQPYPFASYTEELVRQMKTTLADAPLDFLNRLDPASVHQHLVNSELVEQAIETVGGFSAFGLKKKTRTEEISA